MSLPNHDWVQQIHGTVICHRCGVFHTSMAPLFCDVSATDPTDIKLLAASCAVAQAGVEKLTRERDEARAEVARLQKGLDGLLNEREGNERAYRMVREARDHVPCAHKDGK